MEKGETPEKLNALSITAHRALRTPPRPGTQSVQEMESVGGEDQGYRLVESPRVGHLLWFHIIDKGPFRIQEGLVCSTATPRL